LQGAPRLYTYTHINIINIVVTVNQFGNKRDMNNRLGLSLSPSS
jgi:hypothetical protein